MNIRNDRIMEEQKKELNLVEILKDCPKGTKLWSPVFGEIKLIEIIKEDPEYPIRCKGYIRFTAKGRYTLYEDAECVLFPSKENRDWSTFKEEKPKWNSDTLQPFAKVVGIRAGGDIRKGDIWQGDMYLYRDGTYAGLGGKEYDKMIPYNDDTKHLLGTSDEAPEYYRL